MAAGTAPRELNDPPEGEGWQPFEGWFRCDVVRDTNRRRIVNWELVIPEPGKPARVESGSTAIATPTDATGASVVRMAKQIIRERRRPVLRDTSRRPLVMTRPRERRDQCQADPRGPPDGEDDDDNPEPSDDVAAGRESGLSSFGGAA